MKTKTIISAKLLNYLISVFCLLMLSFVPVKDIQTDIFFVKSNSKIDICDTVASSIPGGYNLIYEQDFENHKALNDFVFAREAFNLQEWNTIAIKAHGNHIQTWDNGVPIADFYDNDKKLSASEGFFGLQVHWPVKPEWTGQLRWRNLRIRELDNNLKQEHSFAN